LRREYDGPIYIDIHSYLLGRRRDGTRFSRLPQGWQRVVANADILQMNETEFMILSGEAPRPAGVRRWARDTLTPLRCRCLLVTLGQQGAYTIARRGRSWAVAHSPAAKRSPETDPTGAGDTFTGAWISHYLKKADPLAATRSAARRAANPTRPVI
jgi:sugar/nucleoside kinase (ribokinase family)